jgi:hypothetical protein
MLWIDSHNVSPRARAPIVFSLSAGALLRTRRKKACFNLETVEGGGAKVWLHCPRVHMDLGLYTGWILAISFQKFSNFRDNCGRFGARMAFLGFSLFRSGAGAGSVRWGCGGDSGVILEV